MDEALKLFVERRTGIPADDIETISTWDNYSQGCDTCGHGGGYELNITFIVAGQHDSLCVTGYSISSILEELLEA